MLDKLLEKKHFYNIYIWSLFAFALVVVICHAPVAGAVAFGVIATAALILFSDTTVFLVPVMLLSVFVTSCYDSFDTFIKFLPFGAVLAFAILFHIIKYRRKIQLGKSFWGIAAVAVAVTLGGVGTISASDYFDPVTLYYVFALGGGMVLLYLLFNSRMTQKSKGAVAVLMYAVGLLASFMILLNYIENWQVFAEGRKFLKLQPSNNLCTFIMLAMPFPMFFARKRYIDALATVFMYLCAVFSSSRGGLVMGTVEIFLIFIVFALFYEKSIARKLIYFLFIALGVFAVIKFLPEVILRVSDKSLMFAPDKPVFSQTLELASHYFFDGNEARVDALFRALEDFKANPLFGSGIGNSSNTDIYSPAKGAMHWYHLWTAQIVGGLGILGILAYGYQLISRVMIYFRHKSPLNMTFFMSYIGLWLMSQLNPGEFCPIPYALIAVIYFILIEKDSPEEVNNKWRNK